MLLPYSKRALFSLSFFVVLAEILLRVFFLFQIDYDIEMWRYSKLLKVPSENASLHKHGPNLEATLMGVKVRTNSFGYRGPNISEAPKQKRVLLLGDSFTLGWGVAEEDTMASLLQTKLPSWQVLNTGVGNYNAEQIVAAYTAQGRALEPGLILYFFYLNDADPSVREYSSFLERNSYLYFVIRKSIKRIGINFSQKQAQDPFGLGSFTGKSGEAFWKAIQTLAAENTANRKVAVVLFPELRDLRDQGLQTFYSELSRKLETLGIPCLNLQNQMKSEEGRDYWVHWSDPHPNARANKEFTDKTLEFLVQRKLLSEAK